MYEMYRKGVSKELEGEPDIKVERYPMWHGTTEECAKKIIRDKFDRSKAGSNCENLFLPLVLDNSPVSIIVMWVMVG